MNEESRSDLSVMAVENDTKNESFVSVIDDKIKEDDEEIRSTSGARETEDVREEIQEILENNKDSEHINSELCDSTESVKSQERDSDSTPSLTETLQWDGTVGSQGNEGNCSPSLLETLNLDVPSSYEVEPVDFPNSPWINVKKPQVNSLSEKEDEEEDRSMYQAQLLSNGQDVRLVKDETANVGKKKKIIPVGNDIFTDSCCDESSFDGSHTSLDEPDLDAYLDSPDELDDSIMERLGKEVEPIPVLTAEEERLESRIWKYCVIGGIERRIDLKVLEPYKRVVSHGGYLSQESHNAIIIFSACYLPDRSRVDYDYVMNNLFLYVITTLDELVTDDYILIYLHGATSRSCMPKFKWLKQCYQMIDRKLRKNLKGLYLVHPTFWLKTLVLMTKPFISSKFSKKLFFVYSLSELFKIVPLDHSSIPERVKKYDVLKETLEKSY